MKVLYENNIQAGPGYGKLIFTEIMPPEAPWKYSLQRASDQKYATLNKSRPWVDEVYYIESKGEFTDEGNLILFLDPATVDNLDMNEGYRVTLRGEDGSENSARLRVGQVIYSNNSDLLTPESGKGAVVNQPEVQAPSPQPKTADVLEEKQTELKPESAEPAQVKEITMPAPDTSKNRNMWRWILLCVLAACVIGWFLWDKASNPPEKTDMPAQSGQTPTREELSTEESVRKFFARENKSAEEAMSLARELKVENTADQDALFRLYYFAADQGDNAGILAYAQCYDPSSPQWGTIKKDGALALALYAKAAGKNVPEAVKAQDNLLGWLKDQAEKGNQDAVKWLGQ